MEPLPSQSQAPQAKPASAPPEYLDARTEFAARFLRGEGIEIGALHWPLATPEGALVRYVDRRAVEELRAEYPELADKPLTPVDIVDDGETLATIADGSQDFIVANYFLEHCENPIGTIETHLTKLKPGGVLFYAVPDNYAVPDKRYTFDFRHPVTPLEHMARDHDEGPAGSRQAHYLEWTRLVGGAEPRSAGVTEEQFEDWARRTAVELEDSSFSIHFHVWTQEEFLGLILLAGTGSTPRSTSRRPPAGASSSVVVLRKRGDLPEPSPQTPALSRRADSSGASDHRKWLRSRIRSSLSTGDPPPST